jgi:ABC-2 type transport system permease protein
VLFGIAFLVVQVAFYTFSGYGIFVTRQALQLTFSGVSAPLALYPEWLRTIAEHAPFQHSIYTPVSIYLGWISGTNILRAMAGQVAWAVALFVIGKLVMRVSVRRLEIQGG